MNELANVHDLPKHIPPCLAGPIDGGQFGDVNSGETGGLFLAAAPLLATFPHHKSPLLIKVFGGLASLILRFEDWFGSTEGSHDLASTESKRLAYEMNRAFGIKGFVLNLAGSASLAVTLPACWDALRPCLESPEFEDAAARIQTEASRLAEDLGAAPHRSSLRLSRDEASQLQAGLDFYHFVLPKMLVLTSALRLAGGQEWIQGGTIEGRAPERNVAEEDGLHGLFQDIRRILSLSGFQDSAAMPRAWSKYLAAASAWLMPVVQGENYSRASNQLRTISLPCALCFQDRINSVELDNLEGIAEQVSKLEIRLPSLIISIALLERFFRPADTLLSDRRAPSQSLLPAGSLEIKPERRGAHHPAMGLPTAIAYSS